MQLASVRLSNRPLFSAHQKTLVLDTKDMKAVEETLKDNRFAQVVMDPGSGAVAVQIKNGHNSVIVGRIKEALKQAGIYEQFEG